ncbi:YihY/virulence factor BrkB family protein [Ferribacterium limneticum]|uniref:YihY/virulence factor BrkB family protein n=1 Tax=Ferribacterium limneticum TaxID=76259 RepID=UPI001CFBFA45|nr:YihY/virulence factor BrkB family protein [Ferribacterium limneticum]UCV28766.1 YihY/virulence factor BrkB family protein [Ferribacterium limneticum]UCV32683.1 YihY/virulence factor BrkB family protein [Ferribacterium limneticum]
MIDPFIALRGEPPALQVLKHPLGFVFRVLRGFSTNQGLLLAGAIAYYALLSVVPLLILTVFLLSNLVSQAELLGVLGRYLEWLVPSQSQAVLGDVSRFLQNGIGIGALLLLTMLFFSSLAFSGLEKAMAIIFAHRGRQKKRHFLVSAVLPYCFVFVLGIALLVVTFASASLQAMEHESVHFLGTDWSLRGVSGLLFYLLGLAMETAVLTSLYLIIPVGRTSLSHALIGGFSAALLWEALRHVLVWYLTSLSRVSVVYGSLTTAVVALFCMELAATLLLLGAQVIAEYELLGDNAPA